jgi:hypothetical protein
MTDLQSATLKDAQGNEIKALTLWEQDPVLVVCLRRPGCRKSLVTCHIFSPFPSQSLTLIPPPLLLTVLCREEAIHLWEEREKFQKLGIRMVCILHEWRDIEVKAFAPEYWGGDLYYDKAKIFYKTVHGGSVKKGSLLALVNPFGRAFKNAKRAKASGKVKDSNFVGDGLTLGGVLVLKKGGEIEYSFAEETFGDHADFDTLLAACEKAAK